MVVNDSKLATNDSKNDSKSSQKVATKYYCKYCDYSNVNFQIGKNILRRKNTMING